MGLLSKRRHDDARPAVAGDGPATVRERPHIAPPAGTARRTWANAAAVAYRCTSCGRMFSREEGEAILTAIEQRTHDAGSSPGSDQP